MSPRNTTLSSIAVLALASLTIACANKSTAEATAKAPGQDASAATYATTDPDASDDWIAIGHVTMIEKKDPADKDASSEGQDEAEPRSVVVDYVVEPTLLDACGLTKPELYFETDSDEVTKLGEIRIERVAECLDHPALAEKEIDVIGHADERGPSDYNYELGLDRAESVANELVAQGISRDRIETESRGERMADDPDYWDDRQVLIRLSN